MEQRVVGGGNGSKETCLTRCRILNGGNTARQLERIHRQSNELSPIIHGASSLFCRAAIVVVWQESPFLKRSHVVNHQILDTSRGCQYLTPAARPIGQHHAEKNRRVAAPILFQLVGQPHHVGSEQRLDLFNGLGEFRLPRKASCDHQDVSIANRRR